MFLPGTWVVGRRCDGGGLREPGKEGVTPGDSLGRTAMCWGAGGRIGGQWPASNLAS